MQSEARILRGTVGTLRTAIRDGRETIIIPVTALVAGSVLRPCNTDTSELVPLETLQFAPQSWDGRPVVLSHPDGGRSSANKPDVLETHSFGQIFNSRVEGRKLLMDAWIQPERLQKIGGSRLLQRLRDGDVVEVSVGAFVSTSFESGQHNGQAYNRVWRYVLPDHLAFLPDSRGACSIDMGCGANNRAAEDGAHRIADVYANPPQPYTLALSRLRAAQQHHHHHDCDCENDCHCHDARLKSMNDFRQRYAEIILENVGAAEPKTSDVYSTPPRSYDLALKALRNDALRHHAGG